MDALRRKENKLVEHRSQSWIQTLSLSLFTAVALAKLFTYQDISIIFKIEMIIFKSLRFWCVLREKIVQK